ncbi:MAG: NAD(P)-dependent oxidoreductase [Bacteroidota bacterium]|nr:NAD(P)-dependent oxidoreductase [Bacteroidota bacterium]
MNIVLIGASGFIGSAILKEALDRDHKVKAVVRHPERITADDRGLLKTRSDVSFPEMVLKVCRNSDVVISAYNPGWSNPNIAEDTLRVYPIILEGVRAAGVKRFLVVGGAGSLFVSPGVRMMDSGMIPEAYLPAVKALARFYLENLTAERIVDWVFFSPANEIFPGTRTGKFRLGKDDMIFDAERKSRISREDYAAAMIDEAEKPAHHRERFTIGY